VNPAIGANNFELSLTLITLVERDQFSEHPSDNPNVHLRKFIAECDTMKLDGVSTDAIRLRLFPFSLRNTTNDYLYNDEPNSFTTWKISLEPSSTNIFHLKTLEK